MKILRRSFLKLNAIEKTEIDKFVDDHNGLIFHETKLNEIVSEIFRTNLFYFIAYEEERIIGICPIHSIKKGILNLNYSNNGSFEIPYGGWVYDASFTSFEKLWDETPIGTFESLEYFTSFIYKVPKKIINQSKTKLTGIIDLKTSEEDIFRNSIDPNRRNRIRKAEKSGIIIKNHNIADLPIFFKLMQNMKKKAGLEEIPFEFYERLLTTFLPDKAKILIAYLNDQPLAGVVILGNKNVMHYWLGALAKETPNLGQSALLQWEVIKWAKNSGTKYYDLCVIEPERLPQIAHFKMGFTNNLVPFYCLIKKTFYFRVGNKIQNAFKK